MISPTDLHPSPERLSAFTLGNLNEEESAAVGVHVAQCVSCCAHLDELPDDGFVSKIRLAGMRKRSNADTSPEGVGVDSAIQPPRVPGFEVIKELGRGGMGVVYQARQIGLNRLVALKVLLGGAHAAPRDQARFRQEAETIASLRHPGIVQIHEIGVHEGLPFFAMEFMEGGNLADLLQRGPLPSEQAAKLTERLADAVQAAHDRGIIHRDLKPANVLLEEVDSQLNSVGSRRIASASDNLDRIVSSPIHGLVSTVYYPKIADFGLAKWLDGDAGLTRPGMAAGTPAYMAPEQALGRVRDIGPGVDIFALGAILYEMLAGQPPFHGATPMETVQQVREQEPTPLAKIRSGIPRDLATICNKCLEKTPSRRYRSAAELREDLRRFRTGEPIHARPVGEFERLRMWAWRNPTVTSLFGAVILSLLAGTVVSTYFGVKASRRATEAEAAAGRESKLRQIETGLRRASNVRLYAARMAMTFQAWTNSDLESAQALLDSCRPDGDQPDLRGWEWHYVNRLCHTELMQPIGHDGPVFELAYSPDGKWLASAGGGNLYFRTSGAVKPGQVLIRHAATGKLAHQISGFTHLVSSLAFSADSRLLAAGCHDGTIVVVDPVSGRELIRLRAANESITSLAFDSGGHKLLSASGKIHQASAKLGVRLWDIDTGKTIARFAEGEPILSADLAARGNAILYSTGREICCIDAATSKIRWRNKDNLAVVEKVVCSPDGRLLATAARDGRVMLLDAATGRLSKRLGLHQGTVGSARFSADGSFLATSGDTPEVRIWDVATGELVRVIRGPSDIVETLAFSPDGARLATGDQSGIVKVWNAKADQRGVLHEVSGYNGRPEMRFSTDDRRLLEVLGNGWHVDTVDVLTGLAIEQRVPDTQTPEPRSNSCVSPDDKWLAGIQWKQPDVLYLWDLQAKQARRLTETPGRVSALRFHSDSKWFVASHLSRSNGSNLPGSTGGQYRYHVVVWDAARAEATQMFKEADKYYASEPRLENGASIAISPDGRFIAHAGYKSSLRIWDRQTGDIVKEMDVGDGWCRALTFSGNGRLLAGQFVAQDLAVWNVADWTERCRMKLKAGECGLALSPDGRRLASTDMWGTIRLWETETGEPIFELRGLASSFGTSGIRAQVAFDSTGMRLASFNNNDTTNIFDATPPGTASEP